MMGDIHAQIAALDAAEKELVKFALTCGGDTLQRYMSGLIDYTERLTRARIAELPDGTVEFTDWNDDDGAGSGPVKFHLTLTKRGDEFIVDFTGTSPQGRGALHTNYAFTASCTYAALRCVIDPDIPNNAGFYRPITVIAPEGTFVNVRYPARSGRPRAGRLPHPLLGAGRAREAVARPRCRLRRWLGVRDRLRRLRGRAEEALPASRVPQLHRPGRRTGSRRTGWRTVLLSAISPTCRSSCSKRRIRCSSKPTLSCPTAAAPAGIAARSASCASIASSPRRRRSICARTAICMRAGACSAGRRARGRVRSRIPVPASEELVPSKFVRTMRRGDVFRGEMAASGGYGDPYTRDPAAVLEDVRQEKVTIEHARTAYGVCIDAASLAIDVEATAAWRAAPRGAGEPGAVLP